MVRIGMPRSLLYFKFYPLWKVFLEALGAEIVLSPPTNKGIVEKGIALGFNELCLPVKVYYGHFAYLLENHPDLDFIFIPRYISLDPRGFYCPKFLSLPDAMRGNFHDLPPVFEWEVNAKNGLKSYWAIKAGRQLTKSTTAIMSAYRKAVGAYRDFQQVVRDGVPFQLALEAVTNNKPLPDPLDQEIHPTTIFVLGHPYNVYEDYTNMNMLDRMEKMGVNVMTLESLPEEHFKTRVKVDTGKNMFYNYWGHEQEILQASHFLCNEGKKKIDGVIFIISFACGPDSLISEIVMRDMKGNIPYMALIVDEHSGAAGMQTRIETFIEMIKRRKKNAISGQAVVKNPG